MNASSKRLRVGTDSSLHEIIFQSEDDHERNGKSDDLYDLVMGEKAGLIDDLAGEIYEDEVRLHRLGEDLPEAIIGISGSDEEGEKRRPSELAVAMRRSVGDALHLISRTEKEFLTRVLSPVIGSATSKFFADTSRHFMELANRRTRILLSPKTLGWLIQSLFSRKSFSDILHEKTSGFQVETVYALDKQNFVPLAQVDVDRDIQSLSIVRESLSEEFKDIQAHLVEQRLTHRPLNTMDFPLGSNRSAVMIEGANQVAVAVVEGMVSHAVIDKIHEVSEEIDKDFSDRLSELAGLEDLMDHEIEERTTGLAECLEKGLIEQNVQMSREIDSCPRFAYSLVVLALLALIGWQVSREMRWKNFVADLADRPGILVTKVEKKWGVRRIDGVRDPAAVDPLKVVAEHGFDQKSIQLQFASYLSGVDTFQSERLAAQEQAEDEKIGRITEEIEGITEGITEEIQGIEERFTAVSEREKTQFIEIKAMLASAIEAHEQADMENSLRRFRNAIALPDEVTTEIVDGTLHIKGSLPEPAFSRAKEYGAFLYRVEKVDATSLTCDTEDQIRELEAELAGIRIPFVSGTSVPADGADVIVGRCLEIYAELRELVQLKNGLVKLEPRAIPLTGVRDSVNRRVVEGRKGFLLDQLNGNGISPAELLPFQWDPEPEDLSLEGRGLYLRPEISFVQ